MDRPANSEVHARGDVMLVAGDAVGSSEHQIALSRLRVLKVVGRRSLGSLIEATIVPAVLFYVLFVTVGAMAAMLGALAWAYASVLRRWLTHQRISGVLVLAVVALTVRTIIGLAAGTFIYFMQPIATTVALALVFFGSLFVGRPIIARMASDFCPLQSDVACRPAVARLFKGLTTLWAAVHLVSAAITFTLLVSVSTETFVALRSVVSLALTICAIAVTISWSLRTAKAEELTFAHASEHSDLPPESMASFLESAVR